MHLVGNDTGQSGDLFREQVAQPGPLRDDPFQPRELCGGHGGLRLAHPIIRRKDFEAAPTAGRVAPLVTELLQQRAETFVAGTDHAAVAAGDVLGVLQREASHVPDGADRLAPILAPHAWAQSSIRTSLCVSASAFRASRSHGLPIKCTAMMALVFGVIRRSTSATSRLYVPAPRSANTGTACW